MSTFQITLYGMEEDVKVNRDTYKIVHVLAATQSISPKQSTASSSVISCFSGSRMRLVNSSLIASVLAKPSNVKLGG